jgi:hypothetical protein
VYAVGPRFSKAKIDGKTKHKEKPFAGIRVHWWCALLDSRQKIKPRIDMSVHQSGGASFPVEKGLRPDDPLIRQPVSVDRLRAALVRSVQLDNTVFAAYERRMSCLCRIAIGRKNPRD